MLTLQQPRLLLLKRLAPKLRLVLHLHPIPRHNHRQHRHALRLGEPPSDAPARPPAEGQERVAVVAPQEARGLELLGLVPVARVVVQCWGADRDVGPGGDGDGAFLVCGGGGERECCVFDVDFWDEDDWGEPAEGLVQDAVGGVVSVGEGRR